MTESSISLASNLTHKRNRQSWRSHLNKILKPVFIIAGFNAAPIVESKLISMGWVQTYDRGSDEFNLKWTELLNQVNFYRIRPTQLVNHIPNCGILTNKLGLLLSLRNYETFCKNVNKEKKLHMDDFIPKTFIVDDLNERNEFYKDYNEGDIWICKPVGANQGKGITLIRSLVNFKADLVERERVKNIFSFQAKIIQRYITNPLLIYNKKFDIRCFMLIASTIPYLVLFTPGYVRLSMNDYSTDDDNLITHLTNQFIQKKSPKYVIYKEDTVMSMEGFNEYFNQKCKHLPNFKTDWVNTDMVETMKDIMYHVFKSIKHKLANSTAYFEIYGLDFMIDENLKVWLIEANSNPSMSTQCSVLRRIIPNVIEETLRIVLECFDKNTVKNIPLLPLENIQMFQIIYAESFDESKFKRSNSSSVKSWTAPRNYRSNDQGADSSMSLFNPKYAANDPRRFSMPHYMYKDKFFERRRVPKSDISNVTEPVKYKSNKDLVSSSQLTSPVQTRPSMKKDIFQRTSSTSRYTSIIRIDSHAGDKNKLKVLKNSSSQANTLNYNRISGLKSENKLENKLNSENKLRKTVELT